MQETNVSSWEEFEKALQDLRQELSSPEHPAPPLLFRGHENSCWSLETTLERSNRKRMLFKDYYHLISVVKPQIESFTGGRWEIPERSTVAEWVKEYDKFSLRMTFGERPAYAYMAYLRHHGFPSPLLDWTRSPYVAAYFAFRSATDDNYRKVSIYVLAEVPFKPGGNNMPEIYPLGPRVRTHRRHFLQQSEYTVCLIFEDEWRFEQYQGMFDGPGRQGILWKFNIPATERLKVLKLLDAYNLNAFSLFDSEESLMETMALRQMHFREGI